MKAQKIENIMKMIDVPEKAFLEKTTDYDVTQENWIFKEAQEKAKVWIERYEENPRADFFQNQKISNDEDLFNKIVGLFGEYVVDGVLDQFQIPHNWAKPSYPRDNDPRGKKPWDQLIAGNLTLEVKTNPPYNNYSYLNIDEKSNMHCEYVLGIQLLHEKEKNLISSYSIVNENWNLDYLEKVKIARLVGFLVKEDVDKLECKDHYKKGKPCRRELLDDLRPMNLFWLTILQHSSDPYYRDVARKIIAKNVVVSAEGTNLINDVLAGK